MTVPPGSRVVIGVGNEYRHDDGFGPAVIAALAGRAGGDARLTGVDLRVGDGEPTALLDWWTGCDLAVVVDTVRGDGLPPGRPYEVDAGDLASGIAGSHRVALGSVVALARVLDRLPGRLVVLAVAGRDFGFGVGLSPAVAAAVPPTADRAAVLVGRP